MSIDAARYLQRIGAEAAKPSVPALRNLVYSHLKAVPFENLEIAEFGRSPSLEPEQLYRKVVEQGRGGYCFELNRLFELLLRELGYDCHSVAARVVYHRPGPRMLSHRAVIVRLGNKRWYCDVGFGGPGPRGILSLDKRSLQEVRSDTYAFERQGNQYCLLLKENDRLEPVIAFRDEPFEEQDFELLHRYYSEHPASVFTQKRILYRAVPGGTVSLIGNQFTHKRADSSETVTLDSPASVASVISEKFGLDWYSENWPKLQDK